MAGFETQGFAVGDRVKIAPHTDLWMRGVRYATITKVGRKWLTVEADSVIGLLKVSPHHVDLAPATLQVPRSWTNYSSCNNNEKR